MKVFAHCKVEEINNSRLGKGGKEEKREEENIKSMK